ncbi:SIS domain-containing protein [Amaricoccus sp.]|uniref:SIS domain-containing protein n=1 Tax=Amaricoccus sp. TaxID=1872485 RepID=UPI001B778B29|nr:SIS domain-containing protein [Amaricoccus sp.]MBP7002867.1 SIS domain-containing protein [Amaricoccus sp.]
MTDTTTFMRTEVEDIPAAAARFLEGARDAIAAAAKALRKQDPRLVATVARGSSDHAATYLKYAIELETGVPVASVGPSIASIYGRKLKLRDAACIGVSQSGQSPDIVAMMEGARDGGALTIAISNDPDAPLAAAADHTLALHAGPERSVAATKTFVTSVLAGLALLAEWREDEGLRAAVAAAPEDFRRALGCDWAPLADRLEGAASLYVLGRGPAWAIASEVALKFKETCGVQAASYSAAEVLHGPSAIVGAGFPVLALAVEDAALPQVIATADRLARQGADVFLTAKGGGAGVVALPAVEGMHPLVAPLALAPAFYLFIEALARRRGLNPDAPPNLRKVTETR